MSNRLLIGIALLLAAAGVIVALQVFVLSEDDTTSEDNTSQSTTPTNIPPANNNSNASTTDTPRELTANQPIVLTGFYGSEKRDFLNNPEVKRILLEKYNIEINATSMGSVEQVTDIEGTRGADFLWPSNDVALALYEQTRGSVSDETIFNSPIVLYTWTSITPGLINAGLVEQINNTYYVVDMPRLIDYIVQQKTCEEIDPINFGPDSDLCQRGFPCKRRFEVLSTDPLQSNSGNIFYMLMANLLVAEMTGDLSTPANLTTINAVMPTLKAYYDTGVSTASSSGDFFEDFVNAGEGIPIIVGYENQIIEFLLQSSGEKREAILSRLNMLYPRPTVWSSHPIMALTDDGNILLEALKDEDLQNIAWSEHGFRAGPALGIVNDPDIFKIDIGETFVIPERILDISRLPNPDTLQCMLDYLDNPDTATSCQ